MREDFEAAAIRLAAQHAAFVGEGKRATVLPALHLNALVTDRPVDSAIRPAGQAVHVVTGVGEVDAEAVHERFPVICLAVAIAVGHEPEIRGDGGIDVAIDSEDAGRNAGDVGSEASGEFPEVIGGAIAVAVLEQQNPFRGHRKILPIDGPVAIPVAQVAAWSPQHARSQVGTEKRALGGYAGESDVVGNPFAPLTDIEVGRLAAGSPGHEDTALCIDAAGHRIRDIEVTAPALWDERRAFRGHEGGSTEDERQHKFQHGKGLSFAVDGALCISRQAVAFPYLRGGQEDGVCRFGPTNRSSGFAECRF